MQAKTVQQQNYHGDLDYVRLPDGKEGKVIMPATKQVMKKSTRRHVKNFTISYP